MKLERINIKLIDNYINKEGISKTEFSVRAKISYSVLMRIYKQQNIRINALFKIAKLMGIEMYELFEEVEVLDVYKKYFIRNIPPKTSKKIDKN